MKTCDNCEHSKPTNTTDSQKNILLECCNKLSDRFRMFVNNLKVCELWEIQNTENPKED